MNIVAKPFELYAEHPLATAYASFVPAEYRADARIAPREEWWTWRTHEVHVDRTLPVSTPRELLVVLIHGGGGNGRLLAPLAIALAREGYECVAPDLPPYGLTKIGDGPLTYHAWVALVCELSRLERARTGRAIVLIGLSMGGMTAYHVAARAQKEGWNDELAAVIATTMMDLRDPSVVDRVVARTFLARAGRVAMKLVPSLVDLVWRPLTDFAPVHLVANDPRLVDVVLADPLIGRLRAPGSLWRSAMNAAPDIEPEDFAACPLLVVHPGDDRWTAPELSKRFFDRIKGEKTWVLLPDGGHFPIEPRAITALRETLLAFLSARAS